MKVVPKHDVNRVKNGYAVRSTELGVAASGRSPEIARRNVERLVVLDFKPFEHQGRLGQELKGAGLRSEEDGQEFSVVATD